MIIQFPIPNSQYPMKSQFPMSQLEIEQLDIHWDLVIGELGFIRECD